MVEANADPWPGWVLHFVFIGQSVQAVPGWESWSWREPQYSEARAPLIILIDAPCYRRHRLSSRPGTLSYLECRSIALQFVHRVFASTKGTSISTSRATVLMLLINTICGPLISISALCCVSRAIDYSGVPMQDQSPRFQPLINRYGRSQNKTSHS